MSGSEFEVIIIGGGINGVGVARDCCRRGFRTALVEAEDFGSGATGASSGLIHGGPRYLLTNAHTTKKSCVDSGFIQQITPQMLFRVPFLVPWDKSQKILPELMEPFFSAYDGYSKLKNGKPHVRLTVQDCRMIEPGLSDHIGGGISFDEWGVNPMRLTYLNLLDANRHGLEVFNHTEVEGVIIRPGRTERTSHQIIGVQGRTRRGDRVELLGKLIINLTGPWAPRIGAFAGVKIQIRPSKGVHLVLDRRYTNVAIAAEGIDGRDQMFILPHESTTLLGATDDDYFGDPRNIPITEDEVSYILDAAATILPAIRQARVIRTFAGVRPTLFQRGRYEGDLSREHVIIDHESEDGVGGFISMVGGKLAAYRIMSEECTDLIARKLGRRELCTTHLEFLPGGKDWNSVDPNELEKKWKIPAFGVSRIRFRHGSDAESSIECGHNALGKIASEFACPCEPVTFGEAYASLSREWCESLNDLRRRTRFGMGPCSGSYCTHHGANLMARVNASTPSEWHQSITDFDQHRYQGRRRSLFSHVTVQQEELLRSVRGLSQNIGVNLPRLDIVEGLLS